MPKRENEEYAINDNNSRLRYNPVSKLWEKQCQKCNNWFIPNQEHPIFDEFCLVCNKPQTVPSSLSKQEKARLQKILDQINQQQEKENVSSQDKRNGSDELVDKSPAQEIHFNSNNFNKSESKTDFPVNQNEKDLNNLDSDRIGQSKSKYRSNRKNNLTKHPSKIGNSKRTGRNSGFVVALIILAVLAVVIFVAVNRSNNSPVQQISQNPSPTSSAPTSTAPFSSTPSPSPSNPVQRVIAIEEPSYSQFRDSKLNFSVDYPNSWAIAAPFYPSSDEIQTTIQDQNSKNVILVDYHINLSNYNVYQTAFANSYHLISLNTDNTMAYSYSQFSTVQGNSQSDVYLCKTPSSLCVLTFTYPTDTSPAKIGLLNRIARHMINSINNQGGSSTVIASIIPTITYSPTEIFKVTTIPVSSTTRSSVSTPANANATTLAATISTIRNTSINSATGMYNNFNLGLFRTSQGVIGGDGCYDDTGKFIVLINNQNAKDLSYNQLVEFLRQNKVDQYPYQFTNSSSGSYYGTAENHVNLKRIQNIIDGAAKPSNPQVCGDFAERLHNEAEMAGIRCAYVDIQLSGYYDYYHYGIPSNTSHALNAFQTADRGLVYVDDTNSPGPNRSVKTVDLKLNQEYKLISLFPEAGWSSTYSSMGTVVNVQLTWDGTWKN